MSEELVYVLEKMCSYVNVDYNDINFDENDWYLEYEWTKEQETNFINWLTNEIRINNKIRKGISKLKYRPSKKRATLFANYFNMMFGWKTKIEE